MDWDARPVRIPDAWTGTERERGLQSIAESWASSSHVAGVKLSRDGLERLLISVQSLPYVRDPDGGDWWQGGGYTLAHGGDCEDLATLFVTLALSLGYRARVQWIAQPRSPLNHVTAQVWWGGEWLWAEPTLRGARLGEHPFLAAMRLHSAGDGKDLVA